MSDVFEEVEENLRTEKWSSFAKRWWPAAAGVVLVGLLIAGGFWFVDARKGWTGAEASQAYARGVEALQAQNTTAAEAAFVEAEAAGNRPYRALALMQRAALRVTAEDFDGAVALFDEAAEAGGDPMISDIASLKAAWLLMDTADLAAITARLEPLTETGRPFRHYAREALALARLQHGQAATAQQQLQAMALELDVPEGMRQRVQVAAAMIESGAAASLPGIVEAAGRAAESADAEAQRPGAPAAGAPAAGPGAPTAPAAQPAPAQ